MMMKRNLLCTILTCTFSCLIAAQAFADNVCPNNMVMFTNASGQQICMPAQTQSDFTTNTLPNTLNNKEYAKYQKTKLIHESMLDSGISLELGFGYSFIAAALIQFNLEYQFDASTNDTISVGINTKLDLRLGEDPGFGVDWSLGPAIHFNWGFFRTTAAMGFGFFYIVKKNSDGGVLNQSGVLFELRPELKFDFFLARRLWIGFGFDIPLVFDSETVYCSSAYDSNCQFGVKERTIAFPWFNLDLHVGYKF